MLSQMQIFILFSQFSVPFFCYLHSDGYIFCFIFFKAMYSSSLVFFTVMFFLPWNLSPFFISYFLWILLSIFWIFSHLLHLFDYIFLLIFSCLPCSLRKLSYILYLSFSPGCSCQKLLHILLIFLHIFSSLVLYLPTFTCSTTPLVSLLHKSVHIHHLVQNQANTPVP